MKILILLLSLLLLNCSHTSTQRETSSAKKITDQKVIPFQAKDLFLSGSLVSFKCGLKDGDITDDCKFDLGANISSFKSDSSIIKGKNHKVIGTSTYTTATGETKKCNTIILPNLVLEQYLVESLEPVTCGNDRNIIGLDVFKDKKIYIDNKNKKIIVGYKPDLKKVLNFKVDSVGHIIIPISLLNGKKTQGFFDTGAFLTAVSNKFINDNIDEFYIENVGAEAKDAFNNIIKSRRTIGSVKVSDKKYVAEYVLGIDFTAIQEKMGKDVKYIIGQNIIKQSNWFFDFKNKLWYVE